SEAQNQSQTAVQPGTPASQTATTPQPPKGGVADQNSLPSIAIPPTLQSQGITEPYATADEAGNAIKGERPVDAISIGIAEKPRFLKDPNVPKPVAPQPKTPQETRIVRVLTTNYWIVWALHRIGNPSNRTNQGTWFKFSPDGSYQYGFFDKSIGKGAWSFDGKNATILLDGELLGDDREWSFKISKEEDIMIWGGTSRFHTGNVQVKLINLLFIPKNRKEIGLED
ncbi:MAG: hypothetical protein AAB316_08305, partial [Bacteroidota bacterium]